MRIRVRVIVPIVVVLLVAFISVSIITGANARETVNKLVASQMNDVLVTIDNQLILTENIVSISMDELDKKNVALARSLSAIIALDESNLETEKMTEIAEMLGVDEVYVTDESGIIRWGNVPQFFGLDFHTTEQTAPFLAILDDDTVELAQKPSPRGGDGAMFQYVGVSRQDKPGIVQVGISIQTIDEIRNSMSIEDVVDNISIAQTGGVFILDAEQNVIADSKHRIGGADLSEADWVKDIVANRSYTFEFEYRNEPAQGKYRKSGDMYIVTYILIEELNGYTSDLASIALIIGLIGAVLLSILLYFIINRWVLRPIENASNAKSEFLSNMSHEMRTPMNAIIGMTSIGKRAPEPARKDYAFDKIEEASHHLLSVINDILDMSKIEANKLELSPVEFNFEKLIANVVEVNNFRIEENHQNLIVSIESNIPQNLIGDDQRITQVISNLLSNAVKFTPDGGDINLAASLAKMLDGVCTLRIEVSDTGIGISSEQQSRLFKSFEQAESTTTRKYGGTGLGLAISKRIVELMDGRIWVESEMGKGATFGFEVNVLEGSIHDGDAEGEADINGEAEAGALLETPSFEGHHILLAEDIEINREILTALLEPTHIAIDCAENGEIAVEMYTAAPEKYELILMDLQMPVMDGFEATRRIRTLDNPCAKEVPIIALTANVFRSDIENCLEAGMNDHLGKPIDLGSLIAKLHKFLKS